METFKLIFQSAGSIRAYLAANHLTPYEREIPAEIIAALEKSDQEQLAWFAGFGDSLRQILMNVREHRKALEFGFTEISFNQYGWFAPPNFLDREEIKLEQSEIRIGRGPNHLWAYALSCNYGIAGSSGPLCVFCKKYNSRDDALTAALDELKSNMSKYIGNIDTTNYKQDVLLKTLKAVALAQVNLVQLSLF